MYITTTITNTTASRFSQNDTSTFDATTYPNPFAENFKLNMTTSSEAMIIIKVYDMIGRVIETKQINASDIENQEIGSNYPKEVYNLTINQDTNTKTLRIIKR